MYMPVVDDFVPGIIYVMQQFHTHLDGAVSGTAARRQQVPLGWTPRQRLDRRLVLHQGLARPVDERGATAAPRPPAHVGIPQAEVVLVAP